MSTAPRGLDVAAFIALCGSERGLVEACLLSGLASPCKACNCGGGTSISCSLEKTETVTGPGLGREGAGCRSQPGCSPVMSPPPPGGVQRGPSAEDEKNK